MKLQKTIKLIEAAQVGVQDLLNRYKKKQTQSELVQELLLLISNRKLLSQQLIEDYNASIKIPGND
jgi:hypothetical protein